MNAETKLLIVNLCESGISAVHDRDCASFSFGALFEVIRDKVLAES